uniref:Uncharacterized protein n=1 Tax=Anguilla anguilla TaxID=7936 RepID=A0A0E9PX68_ANGAN
MRVSGEPLTSSHVSWGTRLCGPCFCSVLGVLLRTGSIRTLIFVPL